MDELMKIHENILKAERKAVEKRRAETTDCDLWLRKRKKELRQRDMALLNPIYNTRQEIIKGIPIVWSTALLSHYALGLLLTKDDEKMLKFLESVDVVEYTGDWMDMPGYTITLSFRENPYFENQTLVKNIVYTTRGFTARGSDIEWKKPVPTGNDQQESHVENVQEGECGGDGGEISFFNLLFDPDDHDSRGIPLEVAMLIAEDLWPDAISYFINGNLSYEEECDIVERCRLYLS
ncbi:hypothetical protein MKW94_009053 [Papaver nudicaule]|uniref:Nucleosome assembly protein n=1 Tax=Papaver nudicaule TaxID=74823 RepID=A0AA41VYP0_PAPNU|nr:hypothetical protein [Papaver nudicaule]